MTKYKVTFDFDIKEALESEYDVDEQSAEILDIDDSCFNDIFNTRDKIKEFEDWYNVGLSNEEKITISDINYEPHGSESGIFNISINSELKTPKEFANEMLEYIYDSDCPRIHYQVTGTSGQDAWDYKSGSYNEISVDIDYEDWISVGSYCNINITKL